MGPLRAQRAPQVLNKTGVKMIFRELITLFLVFRARGPGARLLAHARTLERLPPFTADQHPKHTNSYSTE